MVTADRSEHDLVAAYSERAISLLPDSCEALSIGRVNSSSEEHEYPSCCDFHQVAGKRNTMGFPPFESLTPPHQRALFESAQSYGGMPNPYFSRWHGTKSPHSSAQTASHAYNLACQNCYASNESVLASAGAAKHQKKEPRDGSRGASLWRTLLRLTPQVSA